MREAYSPLIVEDDSPPDDDICPRPCTRCGIYQCALDIKHEGDHNCLDCSRPAPWKEPKPVKPAPKRPPPERPQDLKDLDEHFSRVPLAGPCELTSAEYAEAIAPAGMVLAVADKAPEKSVTIADPKLGALELPRLPWLTMTLIEKHTANMGDTKKMTGILSPPIDERGVDGDVWVWWIAAAEGKQPYTVRLYFTSLEHRKS